MKQSLSIISIFTLLSGITRAVPHPPSEHHDEQLQSSPNNNITTTVAVPDSNPTQIPDGSSHTSGGEEYVVVFDQSNPEVAEILAKLDLTADHDDVRYTFNNTAFHGFAASMNMHCIDLLKEMPDVATVEKNSRIRTNQDRGVREGSPWGLERISAFSSSGSSGGDASDMDFTYAFADEKLGQGVDVYVVDTGVEVEHSVFGGRARQGFAFDRNNPSDEDGHGTHCAGTAAGSTFGVASGANVIAVKVLGSDGSGLSSDTMAGMDWIIDQHKKRQSDPGFVGSIMSMSWGLDESEFTSYQCIYSICTYTNPKFQIPIPSLAPSKPPPTQASTSLSPPAIPASTAAPSRQHPQEARTVPPSPSAASTSTTASPLSPTPAPAMTSTPPASPSYPPGKTPRPRSTSFPERAWPVPMSRASWHISWFRTQSWLQTRPR